MKRIEFIHKSYGKKDARELSEYLVFSMPRIDNEMDFTDNCKMIQDWLEEDMSEWEEE